jgi:hypothetical protein
VLVIRNFEIRHYDIVGGIRPVVIVGIVNTVSFAGKVESLYYELIVLLKQWAPLHRSNRPIEYVFVDKVVKAMVILSPLDDVIRLSCLHID